MREEMAAERVKRSDERDQMATATATFRADVRTKHQMVSQQLRSSLSHQRLVIAQQAAKMAADTAAFRSETIAANAAMAMQVRKQMDADRKQLADCHGRISGQRGCRPRGDEQGAAHCGWMHHANRRSRCGR